VAHDAEFFKHRNVAVEPFFVFLGLRSAMFFFLFPLG
jgi:hypothetical protein